MSAHAMINKPEYRIISLHFLSLERVNLFRKLCLFKHEFMDDLKLFLQLLLHHTITIVYFALISTEQSIFLNFQLLRNRKLIIKVVYALGHVILSFFSLFFTVALRATTTLMNFFYKFSLSLSLCENPTKISSCSQLDPIATTN